VLFENVAQRSRHIRDGENEAMCPAIGRSYAYVVQLEVEGSRLVAQPQGSWIVGALDPVRL
jgi:hypothetical protein